MPNVPSELSLLVDQEIEIAAPAETAFAALLEQLGPGFATPDGKSMTLKLELWPGGRWYRDLGDNQGHFWGHVQVVKCPTLLELSGPMFMSYAAVSHLQFRLASSGNKTLLTLRHQALGLIQEDHRRGVTTGWSAFMKGVRQHAEHGK